MSKFIYTADPYQLNYLQDMANEISLEKDFRYIRKVKINCEFTDELLKHLQGASYVVVEGETSLKYTALFLDYQDDSKVNTLNGIAYIYYTTGNQSAEFFVAARDHDHVERIYMKHAKFMPSMEKEVKENEIPISFWCLGATGLVSDKRKLAVPVWDEITDNYPHKTQKALNNLMDRSFRPVSGGQFILWLGEPGTGKTTALRALGREWYNWCDVHYILDPDRFFGTNPDYMMSFITRANRDEDFDPYHPHYFEEGQEEEQLLPEDYEKEGRFMLLVFEDTGELLTEDAKDSTGQALSRFLNLVDGLIGQGLKIIVLITSNQDYEHLNKAVTRPGRCRAHVKFEELAEEEADAWREKHGLEGEGAANLSDLYAIKNEQIKTQEKDYTPIGFGA